MHLDPITPIQQEELYMSLDYHDRMDAKDHEYENILPSSENKSTVLNSQFS